MSLKVQSAELFALFTKLQVVPIQQKVTSANLFAMSMRLFDPCARLFHESISPGVVPVVV
jgi:hypothetical protein